MDAKATDGTYFKAVLELQRLLSDAREEIKELKAPVIELSHLLVGREGVLCIRCFKREPIHPGEGSGVPMGAILHAFSASAKRHQKCRPATRNTR